MRALVKLPIYTCDSSDHFPINGSSFGAKVYRRTIQKTYLMDNNYSRSHGKHRKILGNFRKKY